MTQPTTKTPAEHPEKPKNKPNILIKNDVKDFGDFKNQDNIKKENTNRVISKRLKTPENVETDLEALGIAFNEKLSKLETNEDWISSSKNDGILNFLGFALITAISDFREAGKTEEITLENLLSEQQVTQHSRVKQSLEILQNVLGKQNLPQNSSGKIIQNNWDSYITIINNDVEELMKVPSDKLESVFGTGGTMIGAGIGAWAGKGSGAFTGTGKTILYSGAGAIMGKSIGEAVKKWDSSKTLSENVGKIALDSAKNIFKNGFNVFEQGKEKWKTSTQDEKIGIGAMGLTAAFASSYFFRNGLPSFGGSKNEKSGSSFLRKLFSGKGLAGILLAIATFFGLSKTEWGKGVMDEIIPQETRNNIKEKVGLENKNQEYEGEIKQKTIEKLKQLKDKYKNKGIFTSQIDKMLDSLQKEGKVVIASKDFKRLLIAAKESNIQIPISSYNDISKTYSLDFGDGIIFENLIDRPDTELTDKELEIKRKYQIETGLNRMIKHISSKPQNGENDNAIKEIKIIKEKIEQNGSSAFTEKEVKKLKNILKPLNITLDKTALGGIEMTDNSDKTSFIVGISPALKNDKYRKNAASIEASFMKRIGIEWENDVNNLHSSIADSLQELLDNGKIKNKKEIQDIILKLRDENTFTSIAAIPRLLNIIRDSGEKDNELFKYLGFAIQPLSEFSEQASLIITIGGLNFPMEVAKGSVKSYLKLLDLDFKGFAADAVPTLVVGAAFQALHGTGAAMRKVTGMKTMGKIIQIFALPRYIFWNTQLAPYYIVKSGVAGALRHPIKYPIVKGKNMLNPVSTLFTIKEKKAIKMVEEIRRINREIDLYTYINKKGEKKTDIFKEKEVLNLKERKKNLMSRLKDTDYWNNNKEAIKESLKQSRNNKNKQITPKTPTDEKKKSKNTKEEKKKKPTAEKRKNSKKPPRIDTPESRLKADLEDPNLPKEDRERIKQDLKRMKKNAAIDRIKEQPYYSKLPEGEKKLLSRSVTTIAKYAGTVEALAIIVRMAESENPQMAAVEAAGVMASLSPALLTPTHPLLKAVQVVAIILFGAAAVKFAEDVSNAIDGKVDEWGISKGYYEKTDRLSELTGRLISPFMDIWDNGIVDNFAKGDNAYSYFSDTSYNSKVAGDTFWGGHNFNSIKSVHRGKDKIKEWNAHIENRISKEKKSLEDSQSEFNKLTQNEKNIAKKKYAEYNKKYEITGDESPDEIIKIIKEKKLYLTILYDDDMQDFYFTGHRFLITQDHIKKRISSLETQIINNDYIINQRRLLDNDLKMILNTFSKKKKEDIKVSEYRMLRKGLRRMQTYVNMGIFSEIINDNEENDGFSIATRWKRFTDLDIIKNPNTLPYGISNEIYVLNKLYSYGDAKIESSSRVERSE